VVNVEAGTLVGGRYRLGERIATGAAGQVWRAVDEVLGRPVAVKLLRADVADDEAFRLRFRREARAAAVLAHPGVAVVHDYGEQVTDEAEVAFLVMELVDGDSLASLLREHGRLPVPAVVDLVQQAAAALAAAHAAGVVHRDVKPANLLVRPDGQVKVTDFGIARVEAESDDPLTQTGVVLGTAQYLSPEQATGASAGPPTDVYSLGVVAHEALTGERAFRRETAVATAMAHVQQPVPALPGDMPAAVAALVTSMLAKDPAARPSASEATASAALLRASLDPTATGLAAVAGGARAAGAVGSAATTAFTAATPTPTAALTSVDAATAMAPRLDGPVDRPAGLPRRRAGSLAAAAGAAMLVLALGAAGVASLVGDDDGPAAEMVASTVPPAAPTASPTTATTKKKTTSKTEPRSKAKPKPEPKAKPKPKPKPKAPKKKGPQGKAKGHAKGGGPKGKKGPKG
jgi:tRNA A-37 threonylcarbamoyl transferase component Bud32